MKGFTYLEKKVAIVIKNFVGNFWFLEAGFSIAFTLLLHDEKKST